MKIIRIGYMGSGKTGVGRLLSQRMNLPFLDLDMEISTSEERTIPEIFSSSGEIYFRRKESEILQQILGSGPDKFILSVGGGTPCYGKNLQLMKEAPGTVLVYLKTSLPELTRRLLLEKEQRPLISHLETEELLNDFIRKHLFERTFYYNQSDIVVETDNRSAQEVSEVLFERLQVLPFNNL